MLQATFSVLVPYVYKPSVSIRIEGARVATCNFPNLRDQDGTRRTSLTIQHSCFRFPWLLIPPLTSYLSNPFLCLTQTRARTVERVHRLAGLI